MPNALRKFDPFNVFAGQLSSSGLVFARDFASGLSGAFRLDSKDFDRTSSADFADNQTRQITAEHVRDLLDSLVLRGWYTVRY